MWQIHLLYGYRIDISAYRIACTTHSSLFHMYRCFYTYRYDPTTHKLRSLLERSQREPPPVLRSDNVHTSSWLYTQQFNTCRLLLLLPRVFAAQTAQESRVCTTDSELSIGSTHGLGWVGSDWVEIFFSIFSELGWVVARKNWICPLLLTNFDTLTPQNSENWIDHQNFFTGDYVPTALPNLAQIWHQGQRLLYKTCRQMGKI